MQTSNEFLWFQKYRPNTVNDCILPDAIKTTFQNFIEKQNIPNFVLFGKPGTGKTTIAYALANQIGADIMFINASSSGVDDIRDKVVQFCSSMSLSGSLKLVILDECDSTRFRNGFELLRPVMEQFSKNCRFVLTGNNIQNIPDPIISRCVSVDFNIPKNEKPKLAAQLLKRLKHMLDVENVTYDEKVLVELIMKYFPNIRKIINELQKVSSSGHIGVECLSNISNDSVSKLIEMIKDKRFTDARTWVAENSDMEPSFFYKTMYEICSTKIESASVPELVLILAKYQYQSAFSVDQEINTAAAIVELMSTMRFK